MIGPATAIPDELRATLVRRGAQSLARRSKTSALSYFVICVLMIAFTQIDEDHPRLI